MPKPDIDLSFARYVAARKGEVAARTREGAAYAYAGDIKVRAALDRVRPVTLAVEASVRLWQSVEKARMLGTSVKVTGKQFPRIAKLAETCAETLRIPVPTRLRVAQHRVAERAHLRDRRGSVHRHSTRR